MNTWWSHETQNTYLCPYLPYLPFSLLCRDLVFQKLSLRRTAIRIESELDLVVWTCSSTWEIRVQVQDLFELQNELEASTDNLVRSCFKKESKTGLGMHFSYQVIA